MPACCMDFWSAQLLCVLVLYIMDLQLSGVLPSTSNDTLSVRNKKKKDSCKGSCKWLHR